MSDENKVLTLRVVEGKPQLNLTQEELTIVAELLRRLAPIREGRKPALVARFVLRPAFATALAKLEAAEMGYRRATDAEWDPFGLRRDQ